MGTGECKEGGRSREDFSWLLSLLNADFCVQS